MKDCHFCLVSSLSLALMMSTALFFLIYLFFICFLFLAALGLRCYAWAFSSCGEWELLFIVAHGLLIVVASLVAEQRL